MRCERLFPLLVVVGIIAVQPVATAVHMEIGNFGEVGGLDQELAFGDEGRNPLDFSVVQMELAPVQVLIHAWIGQENLGCAALDNDVEQFRSFQLIKRLRGEDHGGVMLTPGFESFGYVPLDARVPEKDPGFVDEERLERGCNLAIRDDLIRPVQDVEKQGLEKLRVPAHLLEIKALEAGKRNGVLGIVKERAKLPAANPFRKTVR